MPTNAHLPQIWTTYYEILVLEDFGRGINLRPRQTRKKLLEGYLTYMNYRTDWGEIKPDEVREYLLKELAE